MDLLTLIKQKRLVLVTVLLCACIHTMAIETEPEPLNNGFLKINARHVLFWSKSLSSHLINVSKGLTAYRNITWGNSFTIDKLEGRALVEDIAEDLEELLKSKLRAVMDLVDEAERVYENFTYDPDLDIDYLNSKTSLSPSEVEKVVYHINETTDHAEETVVDMVTNVNTLDFVIDKKFKNTPVNYNSSTVHVPTNVYDRSPHILNGAYWTQMLDAKFRENRNGDKSLRWQYFCSSDGFFRVYPGLKWPRDNDETGIDMYDCRVRSWYLQAATCPKNVLILLDTSGSMKGSRMVIARSTVKAILNTLDDDDYFNIVRFSDTIEYIDPCFDGSMMQATEMNKRHLQELIDVNITARSGADFKRAFDTAFHLLNSKEFIKRQSKLCNKAILLITDGVPEHYDEVFKYYTKNFTDIQTRVFTFLIGREVDDDREVRWMACANKGYYSHISTLADVQENVQNYIKVMSRPMVIKRYHNKIWTSIYLDHMSKLDQKEGLQFMTSVAVPVFDTKNETYYDGNLLGVMGTDVPVASLKELVPIHKLGANGFAFLINHNGYIIMHPDYMPFRHPKATQSVLNPYYHNIDLNDVTQPSEHLQFQREIRDRMLSENNNFGDYVIELRRHYDKMRRMVKRNYTICYNKVKGTDFRIGIALPSTSMKKSLHASSVLSVLEECLNETNIEIAPWLYCNDLDPELRGKARIKALLEISKKNPIQCQQKLIDYLTLDARGLKNLRLNEKWSHANRNGINLLFIGTRSGLTRYISENDSVVPAFIRNNTDTLNAEYYIRAIEAVEDMRAGRPRYTFTYSVSLDEEFNSNTSVVTASAPIYEMNLSGGPPFVYAVVGLQMGYRRFEKIFMETTTSELSTTRCRKDNYCSCNDKAGNCYLVDNHGYVVASKDPDSDVGHFFGDVPGQNQVMRVLVNHGVFTGENFTDKQAICEKESDEEAGSAAPNLLNPIKAFLNGIFWTITELILFISEFSLKSLWFPFDFSYSANGQELTQCELMIEGEEYESLGPMEKLAYSQVCPHELDGDRDLNYKPCHKTFTLYRADLSKKYPISDEVPGYYRDILGEGQERAPLIRNKYFTKLFYYKCQKTFAVTWVADTNLLLIVTSNLCHADPGDDIDFELLHRKKNYSTQENCKRRKDRELFVHKKTGCTYDHYLKETKTCGGGGCGVSTKVLLISLFLTFLDIFVKYML